MKTSKTNLFLSALLASAAVLLGTACTPKGGSKVDGSDEVLRALPQNAELAMYFDQEAISESKFSEAVQEMQEDTANAEETKELSEKFTEITGLEDDDVTDFALAISGLDSIQTDPSQLKISGALYAVEPVTAEQIVAAVSYIAEQNGETVEMAITVGEGIDYIEFENEPGTPKIIAAVVTGESDTTVFFGDRGSVDASLAREVGSVPAALKAPSNGLIEGQQGWISVILPESMKMQLAGMTAQGEQMLPGLSRLNSLQSIGIGIKAADALDIAVGFNLGTEDDAVAVEAILNNQLISFAKMMLSGGTPEPLPLLNSLAAAQSGDRAILSMALSLKDISILQEQIVNMIPTGSPGLSPAIQ
tara:strand:+ start:823 stop:1905 length:1083 start_codon:yes stop_codon:yes gene_type:complete